MILTERIKVYSKKSDVYSDLDKLCFQSKNIFNSTLYAIKQAFVKKEKIPSYNDLDRLWRNDNNVDYRSLPYNQSSQQTMRCVYALLKSFFSQVKSSKVKHKVRLPRYHDSVHGRYKCIYTLQCIRRKENYAIIKLNKEGKRLNIDTKGRDICQITILPVANGYAIDASFRVPGTPLKENNGRYAAGDYHRRKTY